jgi:hypothetical protein
MKRVNSVSLNYKRNNAHIFCGQYTQQQSVIEIVLACAACNHYGHIGLNCKELTHQDIIEPIDPIK